MNHATATTAQTPRERPIAGDTTSITATATTSPTIASACSTRATPRSSERPAASSSTATVPVGLVSSPLRCPTSRTRAGP